MIIRMVVCLISGAALASSQLPPPIPAVPPGDVIAIGYTVASLNDPSQVNNLFSAHGDGPARYAELRRSTPARAFRIRLRAEAAGPAITISHEPWGEAQINCLGPWRPGIIFISTNVTLAEGCCTYEEADGSTHTKRLLFVMKKESGVWKIASLRVLAP